MNGEHGCQHVHIVEPHRGVFFLFNPHIYGFVAVGGEVVALNQKFGDGPAHEAGQHESKGGTSDANLHCAANAVTLGENWCPGY